MSPSLGCTVPAREVKYSGHVMTLPSGCEPRVDPWDTSTSLPVVPVGRARLGGNGQCVNPGAAPPAYRPDVRRCPAGSGSTCSYGHVPGGSAAWRGRPRAGVGPLASPGRKGSRDRACSREITAKLRVNNGYFFA